MHPPGAGAALSMSETTFPRSVALWWDNSVIPPVLRVSLTVAAVPDDIDRVALYTYVTVGRDRDRE
jgi:hypothetical protein